MYDAKKFFYNKTSPAFLLCAGLVALVVVEIVILSEGALTVEEYAKRIVQKCSQSSYAPTCYEEEVPKLLNKISLEHTFGVTRKIQDIDRSFQYCHVLGHKIAGAETAKDISKWKEVIQRCPTDMCSNGCTHGAFQERFRKEALDKDEIAEYKEDFGTICVSSDKRRLTGLEEASCYHALGHLFMYVTDADVDASITLCKELAVKPGRDASQVCYDGIFMQIYQPLEPDDFALLEGKNIPSENAKDFCQSFKDAKLQGSCWMQAWPLVTSQIKDPKNVVPYCSYLKDPFQNNLCFTFLIHIVMQMSFDEAKMTAYCEGIPASWRGECFAQTATTLLDTDSRYTERAVKLCELAAKSDAEGKCYKELLRYSTYVFNAGSPERDNFCMLLPGTYKNECLIKR
jgi:hypothetical protein